MKNRTVTVTLFISGMLLFALLFTSGCAKHSTGEIIKQEKQQYLAQLKKFDSDEARYNVVFYDSLNEEPEDNQTVFLPAIIHLLLLKKGSISGLVWNDSNGNRLIDQGEQGVQDIRIYVDNDDSGSYTPGDQAELTDINGLYTIERIKAGTKNVFVDTTTLTGNYEITTSHPLTADLEANKKITNADFGLRDNSGAVNGSIWDKTDDAPIPGVVVYVDLNNDDEISPGEPYGKTNSYGYYTISNLPIGTYKLHVDNGTLDVKYHRTPVVGTNPTTVTFVSGTELTFSLTYIHKAIICGTLQDNSGKTWENITLFIDLNNNGTYDEGEPTASTDESGNYCFDELFPGTYTVLILSEGFDTLIFPGAITVGAGDHYSGVDFTIDAQPIKINGLVWDDESANGEREPEESGLSGVTVFLDSNNNRLMDEGELSTITDDTGTFTFTGLEDGDYYIRVDDLSLLNSYIPTTSPNPVFRVIDPGQTYDEAKFGYRRKIAPVNTLNYPTRLAWGSDGNLYVSDNQIGSVFIFDTGMNVQSELRGLDRPLAVNTDSAGNIYVGNNGRKNVEVYDSLGILLRTIGEGEITTPNDIVFDRDNNVYILDSASASILVYDPEGNFTSTIGGPLDFKYPVSIAISYRDDGSGTEVAELYIADQPSCKIHVYTLDGTFLKSVGRCGNMYTRNWDGMFSGLMAVDIDQSGNIHGLDNNLNVIQVFEPQNGTFVRSYNAYPAENEYRVNLQTDLSIDTAGNRTVIANVGTKNIEAVPTTPAP